MSYMTIPAYAWSFATHYLKLPTKHSYLKKKSSPKLLFGHLQEYFLLPMDKYLVYVVSGHLCIGSLKWPDLLPKMLFNVWGHITSANQLVQTWQTLPCRCLALFEIPCYHQLVKYCCCEGDSQWSPLPCLKLGCYLKQACCLVYAYD